MKKLSLLVVVLLAGLALADVNFYVDNVKQQPVLGLSLAKDGGLTGHRDAGAIAMLSCASANAYTKGCVDVSAQTFTGQKTFSNGEQVTCVAHASLTACNSGNAGLHQCCSGHGNALVHCNGTTNIELNGSSGASMILPPVYVNGLLHLGTGLPIAGFTVPFAYTVTGITGFIGAGTGAGSINLRFNDGTNACDCAVDCDTDQSTFTCSGNCTYAASTLVVISPTGSCTTPPTVKGMLYPMGYTP